MAAIFEAARAFDVEALRRELAAGVDPDLVEWGGTSAPPLFNAVICGSGIRPEDQLQERLATISVLVEAGASLELGCDSDSKTPLHWSICLSGQSPAYQAVSALLIKSGADVNATDWMGTSVLATATATGTAATVRLLISAGAVDLDGALAKAMFYQSAARNCALLLRAGAALPAPRHIGTLSGGPTAPQVYIEKVRAAGNYKAYEKAHRQRLVAIYLPKFPRLPAEMLERIVIYSYESVGH